MSSVGIPEGTEFRGDPCSCLWISTASIPPITRLEKKCDHCKRLEGIPIETVESIDILSIGIDTTNSASIADNSISNQKIST